MNDQMTVKIDWYYFRLGCGSCESVSSLLAAKDIEPEETINESETQLRRDDALDILPNVSLLVVVEETGVFRMNLSADDVDEAEFLRHVIGPEGNLRVPAFVTDETLVIGFNKESLSPMLADSKRQHIPPSVARGVA